MRDRTDEQTKFWRDQAPGHGITIIDKTLDHNADWETVLANGRHELDRALRVTGIKPDPSASVLEIGCGVGRLSYALAERFGSVLGLDVTPAFIEQARSHNDRSNVRFDLIESDHLTTGLSEKFDLIFSYEVFHCLGDAVLARYLADSWILLKPGGRLAVESNVMRRPRWAWATAIVRNLLHGLGVKSWRGWPTAPGFRQCARTTAMIRGGIESVGFTMEKVDDSDPGQAWFVAIKPSVSA